MKGSIAKKKHGNQTHYYVVVDLPHRKGEKRKQKWFPVGTSYRKAEAELPRIVLEVQRKNYMNSQAVLFDDIADGYLLRNEQRLARSTYTRYKGIIEKLKVYFKDYKVSEIEPYLVDQYKKTLICDGYSANTIAKYRLVLNLVFQYAQELQIIKAIPIAKIKQGTRSDAYTFQVWSSEQAHEFLRYIKDSPLYMPVFIAIHTGMRLGEILALNWSEIDFEKQQLSVRYSVDVNGKLKNTKTKQSRRTIKLIPAVMQQLQEQQHRQKLNKLKYGKDYYKNNFVCTFEDGKPLSRNYVSTTFRRKVRQLKFPVIRFHDLRHSFATIALSHNVHVKVVQEILGHSSSRTTLDIYSHVIPTLQSQSLDLLEKAFEN